LVFSAHCNASPQVRREVERAVHRQIPILPFRIEEVLPARSLEYFLSTPHWLDAFPPPREPHYARLSAHITCLLSSSKPASTPMPAVSVPRGSERNVLLLLDVAEIESLERRLAYHVGPVAKYLVKRAASKAANREELTQLLAAEVEAAPARKQFIEACRSGRSVR
jgi:hypothetical protein